MKTVYIYIPVGSIIVLNSILGMDDMYIFYKWQGIMV